MSTGWKAAVVLCALVAGVVFGVLLARIIDGLVR